MVLHVVYISIERECYMSIAIEYTRQHTAVDRKYHRQTSEESSFDRNNHEQKDDINCPTRD